MHEMGIFKDLMEKIESISKENNGKKILKMKVKLGALSHLSPSHFQEHFDCLSKGTAAEGAKLEIEMSKNKKDPFAQKVVLVSIDVEG